MGLVATALLMMPHFVLADCVKGDCVNGYGVFIYADGARYEGDFLAGKPHGRGILQFANGNKYLGHWDDSYRQGEGRLVFAEGHEYKGEFLRNAFHGYGVMTYANGDRYEGQWAQDRPHGEGSYFFKNGQRYEGEFREGRFHGQGTMFYADGARLDCRWEQGVPLQGDVKSRQEIAGAFDRNCNLEFCQDGTGNYTYSDGSRYLGEFFNGLPEGQGTTYYINGDRYTGGWKQHAPHGAGTMYYKSGRVLAAEWERGRPLREIAPSPPSSTPASPTSSPDVKIWAVVTGVAQYQHMPVLKYTDDDAYQVYAFLKSPEGGALPENQVRLLVDEDATRHNILNAMRDILLRADENDVVLFYFSGHGLEGCFLPFDYDGLNNKLMHEDIIGLISQSRARHKLVIADACHSGSLLAMRSGPIDASLARFYQAFENSSGGLALMLSSKGEEYSLEDGGLRSGVFSHYLIRGLKGTADFDSNKIVTIGELYTFVQQKVQTYTARAQNPILKGQFDYNMPIGMIR